MTTMIARYERGRKLNVRKEPNALAPVVGTMENGDVAECREVRDGWAEVEGGYARADLLVITAGDAPKPEAVNKPDELPEEPVDDSGELDKMTVPALRELAEQSGIKLEKGMKKHDIIAAILADD